MTRVKSTKTFYALGFPSHWDFQRAVQNWLVEIDARRWTIQEDKTQPGDVFVEAWSYL